MTAQDPKSGRFVKGQSGNPSGRPKSDLSITALIDEAVTADDWKKIINVQKTKAMRGDSKAAEWLTDRRFGKAMQPTENKHDLNIIEVTRKKDE